MLNRRFFMYCLEIEPLPKLNPTGQQQVEERRFQRRSASGRGQGFSPLWNAGTLDSGPPLDLNP
jgi:hypothetical protein